MHCELEIYIIWHIVYLFPWGNPDLILYVLTAGPDSPTSPVKDLTTHTRALKLKHQSLEDRLELCLLELRKLCIREAVSISDMIHVHTIKTSPFLLDQDFYFEFHRSWPVNCPQTTLWCPKKSHPVSGGGLERPSSSTKGWSIWIKRYRLPSVFTVFEDGKSNNRSGLTGCLYYRTQSCNHWKLTWPFRGRFMRQPANSPWRSTSVNHRRRVGCSSARGRRRKWKNCRRPCSSTGSRASATRRTSPSPPARTMVSDTAAPFRPRCSLLSWVCWVGLMKIFTTLPLCTQIWACLMTVPCQMWWPWMMVSKEGRLFIYALKVISTPLQVWK